jgi:predicted metal-dependent hydrolase
VFWVFTLFFCGYVDKMDYQEIMKKYTKLVAKRLYDIDKIYVEFDYYMWDDMDGADLAGSCDWDEDGTIYFNSKYYDVNYIEEYAWMIIVHEITHCKVWGHAQNFQDELKNNLKRVDDLRKEFNKEVGWEEDFIFKSEEII